MRNYTLNGGTTRLMNLFLIIILMVSHGNSLAIEISKYGDVKVVKDMRELQLQNSENPNFPEDKISISAKNELISNEFGSLNGAESLINQETIKSNSNSKLCKRLLTTSKILNDSRWTPKSIKNTFSDFVKTMDSNCKDLTPQVPQKWHIVKIVTIQTVKTVNKSKSATPTEKVPIGITELPWRQPETTIYSNWKRWQPIPKTTSLPIVPKFTPSTSFPWQPETTTTATQLPEISTIVSLEPDTTTPPSWQTEIPSPWQPEQELMTEKSDVIPNSVAPPGRLKLPITNVLKVIGGLKCAKIPEEIITETGLIYQYIITGMDAEEFYLDFKNHPGTIDIGKSPETPDVILKIDDESFVKLLTKKNSGTYLYMWGYLNIVKGTVMQARALETALQKMSETDGKVIDLLNAPNYC